MKSLMSKTERGNTIFFCVLLSFSLASLFTLQAWAQNEYVSEENVFEETSPDSIAEQLESELLEESSTSGSSNSNNDAQMLPEIDATSYNAFFADETDGTLKTYGVESLDEGSLDGSLDESADTLLSATLPAIPLGETRCFDVLKGYGYQTVASFTANEAGVYTFAFGKEATGYSSRACFLAQPGDAEADALFASGGGISNVADSCSWIAQFSLDAGQTIYISFKRNDYAPVDSYQESIKVLYEGTKEFAQAPFGKSRNTYPIIQGEQYQALTRATPILNGRFQPDLAWIADGTSHIEQVEVVYSTTLYKQQSDGTFLYESEFSYQLVEGVDYSYDVSEINPNVWGVYQMHFDAIAGGRCSGQRDVSVSVCPRNLSYDYVFVDDVPDQYYTGDQVRPELVVRALPWGTLDGWKTDEATTLLKDRDYTLSYCNNVSEGTASVTIAGKGWYSGSKTVSFAIRKQDISTLSVDPIAAQKFTGNSIIPHPVVRAGNAELIENVDYTLSWENNVKEGMASITIVGKGKYTGTRPAFFCIRPAESVRNGKTWLSTTETRDIVQVRYMTVLEKTYNDRTNICRACGYVYDFTKGDAGDIIDEHVYSAYSDPLRLCNAYGGPWRTVKDISSHVEKVETVVHDTVPSGYWSNDAASSAWTRYAGAIALDTMEKVVNKGEYEPGGAVVVATVDGYWDALTASGVAGLAHAPVLLTDGAALSSQTESQLRHLAPRKVIICGGVSAISEKVESQIRSLVGVAPTRMSGSTATETACDIFDKAASVTGMSWSDTAFIATNDGYWDALSIAPFAYAKHCPIFLSEGADALSYQTLSTLKAGGIKQVYIVGGTSAVSSHVETQLENWGITFSGRLSGRDAIATSIAIAEFELEHGMSTSAMGVATRDGYWDALTGAALCGKNESVLVLVADDDRSAIDRFVKPHASGIAAGCVFGGEAAVSPATFNRLVEATK